MYSVIPLPTHHLSINFNKIRLSSFFFNAISLTATWSPPWWRNKWSRWGWFWKQRQCMKPMCDVLTSAGGQGGGGGVVSLQLLKS